MRLELEVEGRRYRIGRGPAASLAIALDFAAPRLNAFGAPPPSAAAIDGPGFVGATRRGGSCNVAALSLVPHCHGTHTECLGHLVDEPLSVHDVLRETLLPATLVSVAPEPAAGHPEADPAVAADGDLIVSARVLEAVLGADAGPSAWHRALVLRTLPNGPDKLAARYDGAQPPAYLSRAAGRMLAGLGCEHVVVDIPSLDRMADGGRLAAHRAFFGLPDGSRRAVDASRPGATITELAYVPPELADGRYLLDLQLAAFALDAAPSRPMLIALEEVG
jgi:hypothetical protein